MIRPFITKGLKLLAIVYLGVICLTSQAAKVTLDNFETGKIKGWYTCPKTGILLKTVDDAKTGKNAALLDLREQSGFICRVIPSSAVKGTQPYGLSMWIKAGSGNQKKSFNLIVKESKGQEKYFKAIPIPATWQKVEVKFDDMKIFPYGGAKIIDRKLDVEDIGNIRFESYPAGTVILLDDLTLLTGKKVKQPDPEKKEQAVIKIDEIKLDETFPDYSGNYPAEVQNVSVDGSCFTRNGKKTFLLGGWQADNEGSPWLFRTLGIDVYPFNATEIYTLYTPKKDGNEYTLTWKGNPWYEAIIHRALKNNVMFWHEHKASARYSALKRVPSMKEVIDAGHFVAYDPFNILGLRCYNEMFKTWMRYTRKYPVFCYELFNEMVYYNDKQITRDAFKNEMRQKYQQVEKANNIWGTQFKSFADVQPPGFIASNAMSSGIVRDKLKHQEGTAYPNLWIDWIKFQEKTCGEAVACLMKIMRSHDPAPSKLSTLQSHCQLFYDYGDTGITPEAIDKNVDFYSHEIAQTFYLSNKNENIENIKKMIRTLLTNDLVRSVTQKPIFNAESPIGISRQLSGEDDLLKKDLVGLNGIWKFADGTESRSEDWNQPSCDDSKWANITVPGMWGRQGFSKCKKGLYRKHFKRPAGKKGQRFYLNGKAFADSSTIYLNGKKVGSSKGYNAPVSVDLTDNLKDDNVLAIEIHNSYFRDNMYFGGIRGYAAINTFPAVLAATLRPAEKHFRSHLWSQIAHGMSGVMVCYDYNLYSSPAKVLPKVKKEIETVTDIIMPRPRINAQVAVVYPKETLRSVLHKGYIQKLSGPATSDLLNAYGPALFSGLGTDIIQNSDICNGKADQYKMLVMAGNLRGYSNELAELTNYVKNGGILVADCGSLQIDDNSHQKLSTDNLFGINITAAETHPITLEASPLTGNKDYVCENRFSDKMTYEKIRLKTARALLHFKDGSPAVTVRELGRGKAYYIAGNLPYRAYDHLLNYIFKANNLKPDVNVCVDTKEPLFIESNLFSTEGRHVLYLLNWGKDRQANVKLPNLDTGNYTIRNLATGNTLNYNRQATWSSEELQNGIPMQLNSLDTVALLLEKSNVAPLTLKGISPARYKLLDQLWTIPEDADKQKQTVAFAPIRTMTDNFGETPTAKRILELNGFKTENYIDTTKLDDVNVLIWYSGRKIPKNPEKIIEFVKNGGGLLLTGNGIKNYHDSLRGFKPFFKAFGFSQAWMKYLYTKKPAKGDDMLNVSCKVIDNHPITKYVKEFITSSAGEIACKPESCSVLLTASENSSSPGAKVMIAKTYGKGKVVFISDYWWLRPLNIDKADNAQLWLNTINWLAGNNSVKLTPEAKEQALFISDQILKQAENEEKSGQAVFKPFSKRKSSHNNTMNEYFGTAGGDPIVDALQ